MRARLSTSAIARASRPPRSKKSASTRPSTPPSRLPPRPPSKPSPAAPKPRPMAGFFVPQIRDRTERPTKTEILALFAEYRLSH
jgi:hypothetical protein